ncbi:MAG TPA: sarcosine oxidase subunit gamma family protein [Candidatus Binatia bacterium]|jgi:sarcosine oxidase subunit alpha|nr:sarcosine oxidase subunit gamma family protein [Candidatus Binatia bacterium]
MAIPRPTKRTALHYTHLALGAVMVDDHGWQRPEQYGSPEEEIQAVHTGVGLCDISPVGKLDLKGRESVRVLEPLFSANVVPRVGQAQWTATKTGDGVTEIKGLCCRLSSDHLLMVTEPGTVTAAEQALQRQVEGADGCAHLTNLTSALAAVQLVGPRSRDLLCKLTALDLSLSQFSDLTCAQGSVAQVHALVVRSDIGSALAYEIYCGREFAEYLWNTLRDAGQEFAAVPFGVAAQRFLRGEG